jgi:hypothetical protein
MRLVLQLPPKLSCSRCVRRLDLQEVQHASHDINRRDTAQLYMLMIKLCITQQSCRRVPRMLNCLQAVLVQVQPLGSTSADNAGTIVHDY